MKLKIINNGLRIEKTDFHNCRGNYMESNMKVKIQGNRSNKTEYLIRDIDDIIIGRFSTDELTGRSKHATSILSSIENIIMNY